MFFSGINSINQDSIILVKVQVKKSIKNFFYGFGKKIWLLRALVILLFIIKTQYIHRVKMEINELLIQILYFKNCNFFLDKNKLLYVFNWLCKILSFFKHFIIFYIAI